MANRIDTYRGSERPSDRQSLQGAPNRSKFQHRRVDRKNSQSNLSQTSNMSRPSMSIDIYGAKSKNHKKFLDKNEMQNMLSTQRSRSSQGMSDRQALNRLIKKFDTVNL